MPKYSSLLALPALFLSACSITAHTPMTRFESPEVQGETFAVEGFAAYHATNEITLTDNYLLTEPSISGATSEIPGHEFGMQGAVGLGERFDISLGGPTSLRAGAKFQILGDPRKVAIRGNFPVSIYGGYSQNDESESGLASSFGTGSGYRTYELKEERWDLGLVAGYRVSDTVLIYGGPFMVWDVIGAKFYSANGLSDLRGTARVYNFNLGVQTNLTDAWILRAEVAGSVTELRKSYGRASWGIATGAFF